MAGRSENLRPWPKGVSGNPSGRPRKKLITDELERLLEQSAPRSNGKTYAAVIAEALVALARKGDVRAISELTSRVEGKPLQALSVGYEDPVKDLTNEELEQRIRELEEQLQLMPRTIETDLHKT